MINEIIDIDEVSNPIKSNSHRNKKMWLFNVATSFEGNPKWLFLYINKFRKDIDAYWITTDAKTVEQVRGLGFKAELFSTAAGGKLTKQAGVYVVNQVKEFFPENFNDEVVILNLWHGVGIKTVEKKVGFGALRERIIKKYIEYNTVFRNNQLFLVTSPLMEKHFQEQIGIEEDMFIRAGYPLVSYPERFSSFDHDIRSQKGLDASAKIVLYAPTYRDGSLNDFFGKAIPDMEKLVKVLEANNLLLVFKMHNLMINDVEYNSLKEMYENHPHLLFWDNTNDIYEIFNQIETAIVDYSSIFYDLEFSGVTNFIRYTFDKDEENNMRDFVFDYDQMTFGETANSFDDLLKLIPEKNGEAENQKRLEVNELFWSYSSDKTFDEIIDRTLNFTPKFERVLPKLYSFDIFDTVIQRKTLAPSGIFYFVKDKLKKERQDFSTYVIDNYPRLRSEAEGVVRDYYRKSIDYRQDDRLEIHFYEIFERLQKLYNLTDEQVSYLMETETAAEIANIEGMPKRLDVFLELLEAGEDVILVSDMYLPKETIQAMLQQADPRLLTVPLFLSSDYGDQKSTKKLYLKVFEELDYTYSKWIHFGDNHHADIKQAKALGIDAYHHEMSKFNKYENGLINRTRTYDSYVASALLARFRENNDNPTDYYAYSYISMYFVPYVSWSIKDAMAKGIDTLYFISRDGHILKHLADKIIEVNNYDIKTKYIYGSRKAWRIPSFIDKIDDEFYSAFGSIAGATNFDSLLKALALTEEEFNQFFPTLSYFKKNDKMTAPMKTAIKSSAFESKEYNDFLLAKAKGDRENVTAYILQEIDFDEKFAFVEYWGRGYTQSCFDRLLNDAVEQEVETIFYYARSIYMDEGTNIRVNYTSKMTSLIFTEAIFANIPYQSVAGYQKAKDGLIEPIMADKNYDKELYDATMTRTHEFIADLYAAPINDWDGIERSMYDFSVDYFRANPTDHYIVNVFASLKDSVRLFEDEVEYAPPITLKNILPNLLGKKMTAQTKNKQMSLARSPKYIQFLFKFKRKYVSKAAQLVKKIKGTFK